MLTMFDAIRSLDLAEGALMDADPHKQLQWITDHSMNKVYHSHFTF